MRKLSREVVKIFLIAGCLFFQFKDIAATPQGTTPAASTAVSKATSAVRHFSEEGPSATGKKNPEDVPYILQMSVDSSTTASTSNVQYGSSASCVEFAKTNKQCPTGNTPYLAVFPIGGGTANSSTGMQGLSATACQPVSISSNCPGSASSCYSLQTKSSYETAVGGATSGLQLSWVVYCCPNGNGCPSTTPIAQAQAAVPVVTCSYYDITAGDTVNSLEYFYQCSCSDGTTRFAYLPSGGGQNPGNLSAGDGNTKCAAVAKTTTPKSCYFYKEAFDSYGYHTYPNQPCSTECTCPGEGIFAYPSTAYNSCTGTASGDNAACAAFIIN